MPDSTTVNFVTSAEMFDMKEIAAAKIALKKAKSTAVKSYANKMIEHYTMTSKSIMTLVKSKGYQITPPPAPTPDPTLASATGSDFDRAYITMIVADHRKAIALFTRAFTHMADPAVKVVAAKTLPMLKEHLLSAKTIAAETKNGMAAGM